MKNFFFRSNADELQEGLENLTLKKELQEARLELVAHDQAIAHLTHELESMRARQSEFSRETATNQLETLFRDAAGPTAQLITQAYLVDVLARPVQPRDILHVARRLVRILEKHGLTVEGAPGDEAEYNPDFHIPLGNGSNIVPGQRVIIRIPAISFAGQLLARAGVEAIEAGQ